MLFSVSVVATTLLQRLETLRNQPDLLCLLFGPPVLVVCFYIYRWLFRSVEMRLSTNVLETELIDVDSRDISRRVGPGEGTTVVSKIDVTYGSGSRQFIVNNSFVNRLLIKETSILPLDNIRKLYGLDRDSMLSNERALELLEDTCLYAHLLMIDRQVERREHDQVSADLLHETSMLETDARRFWRLARRNWYHPKYFILMLAFVVISFVSSTMTGLLSNTLSSASVNYPIAIHVDFSANIPEPPLRIGVVIRSHDRKTMKRTCSHALVADPPRIRNIQFDRNSPVNATAAMKYRLGVQNPLPHYTPEIVALIDREIDSLAQSFTYDDFEFIDLEEESIHAWIDSRPYTSVRKAQLHQQVSVPSHQRERHVEPFLKNESYAKELAKPRFIVARKDGAKIEFGPIFQPLNDWLFSQPFCIKHIPTNQRPAYIEGYMPSAKYFVTDHSAFECAATPEVQNMIEQKFYRKIIPAQYHRYLDLLLEEVHLYHRTTGCTMTCPAIRFSGEMNTSLGNTLVNYVSLRVAAQLSGYDVRAVVEGDDALIAVPADADPEIFRNHMTSMGFNIKIDQYITPGSAGFCSMYWTQANDLVINLIDRLPDLFWADRSSISICGRTNLLNAKLASLSYEAPQTPVLYQYFTEDSVETTLNLYELECLSRETDVVALHNSYTFHGQCGFEPTMEYRQYYADITGLQVIDQLTIESLNATLQQKVEMMYLAASKTDFARRQYLEQVERHQ